MMIPTTFSELLALVRDTLAAPSEGARRVLAMHLPRAVLWQALVLVVVLSVLLTEIGNRLMTSPADPILPVFLANPLLTAAIQFALLGLMILAIQVIGRAAGGTGRLGGAVALVTWLQCVMVALQLVQTVALFLAPPIAGVVGILGIVLFFWLLTYFVTVLHGFESAGRVFLTILGCMIGAVILLSILLAVLGVPIQAGG